MFHLVKDKKNILLFFLGILIGLAVSAAMFEFGWKGRSSSEEQSFSFLLGQHCYEQSKTFFPALEKRGFSVELYPINYRFNEYKNVKYLVKLTHVEMASNIFESVLNGAVKDCWTNSEAVFDILDDQDFQNFGFYIRDLISQADKPVIVEVDQGKVFVRTRE